MRTRPLTTAVLMALVLAGALTGCGDESSTASPQTTTKPTSLAISPEQAAFDRVAKGHMYEPVQQKVDRSIAKAVVSSRRPELWALVSLEITEAARSGDGYDTGTARLTKAGGRIMLLALKFWDRYARSTSGELDDAAFRQMVGAFGDDGLSDPDALETRLLTVASRLTDDQRQFVLRLHPDLTDAVQSSTTTDESDEHETSESPKPFLTPAPTIRYRTEDGFKFALRMTDSRKLLHYPDDSVDAPPGQVLLAVRLEITNETPGRRTSPAIGTIGLNVRDRSCQPTAWKGLCSSYTVQEFSDSSGDPGAQLSGNNEVLKPGVPWAFWLISEPLKDRPARDITLDVHSYGSLSYASPPATKGDPRADVRRLNFDGPALRPCGGSC